MCYVSCFFVCLQDKHSNKQTNLVKSLDSTPAAFLSPLVRAPRFSNRRAMTEANLLSPASSEMRNKYCGGTTWLDLCVLPNCCIALSAVHGSSSVMCSLCFWFLYLQDSLYVGLFDKATLLCHNKCHRYGIVSGGYWFQFHFISDYYFSKETLQ